MSLLRNLENRLHGIKTGPEATWDDLIEWLRRVEKRERRKEWVLRKFSSIVWAIWGES